MAQSSLFSTTAPPDLIIHTDGGARGNPGPAAIGYLIHTSQDVLLHCSGEYIGETTNNVAEYTAVIRALEYLSSQNEAPTKPQLSFFVDSQLIANQLRGTFKIKQPHLRTLSQQVHALLTHLEASATFSYIPRAQNAAADALVNQALDAVLM